MKPEEVDGKIKRMDNSVISPKAYNTLLGVKGKKRELERRDKRSENTKLSKEDSKTVAARLQKKLIERGKKPNHQARPLLFCVPLKCVRKKLSMDFSACILCVRCRKFYA